MTYTVIILIITCIISIISFNNSTLFQALKHYPVVESENKEYYRWLTSGFVHADFLHLGLNMFVFYEFGRYVESYFVDIFGAMGAPVYGLCYLLIIIMANSPTYSKHKNNYRYSSVGASGGVAGILFMFILMSPYAMLGLYFIIPIPAIIFGVLYLWYSSWASKNSQDNIDHDAHFFGAIAGIVLLIMVHPPILSDFLYQIVNDFPL